MHSMPGISFAFVARAGSIPTAGISIATKDGRQFTESTCNAFGVALRSHLGPAKLFLAEWDPNPNGTKHDRSVDDHRPRAIADQRCLWRPVVRLPGVANGQSVFSHHPQPNRTTPEQQLAAVDGTCAPTAA
jgi:hypothetical protein